ncbi:MAG: S53 family peptidase [Terracidiphilus sp.]|jgi:kumamolisin
MTDSTRVKCHPYFKHWKPRSAKAADGGSTAAPSQNISWTVPNLCAAYNWPTGIESGGLIGIVELGGGWVQSDITAYFQSIGQPVPSITDVSVDGTKNTPNQPGSAGEADFEVGLDIEVAGASYYVATGKTATIRVYWSQDIGTAIAKAASDGCDVCSISWGADEAQWGTSEADALEQSAETATAGGMLVFGAAGDNDSSDGGPTPANVDCPSSCPHVVGCGGTSKTATSETVWNDNPGQTDGSGTGGGYSTIFPAQSWQIGAPPAPASTQFGTGRMVPDVSADGDPETGYVVYIHGSATVLGGTSAVAPLYAGLFAAFGKKLGFVTSKLWENQKAFNDITVGSNGMYSAAVGPDACSGIGSPIGTKIAALFVSPAASEHAEAEKRSESKTELRPKA